MENKKTDIPNLYFKNFENELKLKIKKNDNRQKTFIASFIIFTAISLSLFTNKTSNNQLPNDSRDVVNYLIEEEEINESLIIDFMAQIKNNQSSFENEKNYLLENVDTEELENLILETI